MKPFPVLLLSWLSTGFGALLGSILGNAAGAVGLKAGAIAGGVVGLLVALSVARRRNWISIGDAPGGMWGGLAGFAVAIVLTLSNMGTPIVPVLSCGLAGVGVLLGAGVTRGWRGPR